MWVIRPRNVAQTLRVTGPGEGLALRRGSEGKGGEAWCHAMQQTSLILLQTKQLSTLGERSRLGSSVCAQGLSQRLA